MSDFISKTDFVRLYKARFTSGGAFRLAKILLRKRPKISYSRFNTLLKASIETVWRLQAMFPLHLDLPLERYRDLQDKVRKDPETYQPLETLKECTQYAVKYA